MSAQKWEIGIAKLGIFEDSSTGMAQSGIYIRSVHGHL